MEEQAQEIVTQEKKEKFSIPVAIVVAGLIIAGAIVLNGTGITPGSNTDNESFGNNNSASAEGIRPVDESDHVRGNRDAAVSIVEFSDLECPFCAQLHPTLSRVLEESPDDVKWVYRHFPLNQIHPNAEPAAIASECIASLAGGEAFWDFIDQVFTKQILLNQSSYVSAAVNFGINEAAFLSCLEDDSTLATVNDDLSDALASGGRGTPYVVVINADGDVFPFSGALPYGQVRSIIDQAIEG